MTAISPLRIIGVVAVFATACATTPPPIARTTDPGMRAEIERGTAAWAAAVNRGDMAAMSELYTEEGFLMPPNSESIRGRAGIRGFGDSMAQMGLRDVILTSEEIETCGDLAYEAGSYSMSLQPPGASRFIDRGKYLVVWKRSSDGKWRMHRDMFSSNLPLP